MGRWADVPARADGGIEVKMLVQVEVVKKPGGEWPTHDEVASWIDTMTSQVDTDDGWLVGKVTAATYLEGNESDMEG